MRVVWCGQRQIGKRMAGPRGMLHLSFNDQIRRVSLEGVIGAGKSRFLGNLRYWMATRPHRHTTRPQLTVVDEPVKTWCNTTDAEGKCVLNYFYDDIQRYSFMFQINALMTRYSATTQANDSVVANICDSRCSTDKPTTPDDDNYDHVILSERTVETDRSVFAKMLKTDGHLSDIEWRIYDNTFNTLTARRPECVTTDGIIYVYTPPTEAKRRIDERNRTGEDMSFEYLCRCEEAHNDWLSQIDCPVLVVDGSIPAGMDYYNLRHKMSQPEFEGTAEAHDPDPITGEYHDPYAQLLATAVAFLSRDPTLDDPLIPNPTNDWTTALAESQAHGVALFDINAPKPLGQEVEAVEASIPVVPAVVDAVGRVPEYIPEQPPLEEPAAEHACA